MYSVEWRLHGRLGSSRLTFVLHTNQCAKINVTFNIIIVIAERARISAAVATAYLFIAE